MKKLQKSKIINILIVTINVLFVAGIFLGEWQYIRSSNERTIKNNEESFLNTNKSLSSMTNNYLLGESHLCRSWSNYINSYADDNNPLTIEEAASFVSKSITDREIMGHIVYKSTYKGLSVVTDDLGIDPKEVSYSEISNSVFTSDEEGIKTSPRYSNPANVSVYSIAFYTEIELKDPDNPLAKVDAYLLRVVPVNNLLNKWTFPSGSFEHLEVAIIDSTGVYIIDGRSFRHTNFFEYYSVYNPISNNKLEELKTEITTGTGSLVMYDSIGEQRYLSYSHVSGGAKWTVLTTIPLVDITDVHIDWLAITMIALGLGILFAVDLAFLLILNRNYQNAASVAESANKAKTDFLSTMSHDIRTPMNAIVGLTTIAKKNHKNPDSTQDALKKIELASNHLLTLINDILDLSKVESGKLTINPLTFSIVDTFENLVNISQPMVKAKNINFAFRVHNFEHEWLYTDKLRLSQIFTNLLSNALKYTEENGQVTVDVQQKPSEKEGCVQLIYQVSDTGIGMSPEFVARMYQPFSRATDSRINSIQGTGLGLAITKQMVELMNGRIECESELGKGTTFTVCLDIEIGEKPNEELILPPIDVLVVDDDEVLLETAVDALSSLGAKTDIATNGQEALEKIEARKDNQYKVIILDWKMPDMSGLEVSKKIKEMHHEDIPIILVSAYDWSEIEKEAKDSGISGFIFKPLFRSKIYQKIIELIDTNIESAPINEEEADFSGTNVLVVEDNDINWEVISTLLEMHGVTSERAENGKIALELLEEPGNENRWDLIFMDIQMPVMNGLDATRAIRKLDSDYARNVPIIAMTADAFSENVAECIEAGMNGHIAKPIDLNLVLAEIRKIKSKI